MLHEYRLTCTSVKVENVGNHNKGKVLRQEDGDLLSGIEGHINVLSEDVGGLLKRGDEGIAAFIPVEVKNVGNKNKVTVASRGDVGVAISIHPDNIGADVTVECSDSSHGGLVVVGCSPISLRLKREDADIAAFIPVELKNDLNDNYITALEHTISRDGAVVEDPGTCHADTLDCD